MVGSNGSRKVAAVLGGFMVCAAVLVGCAGRAPSGSMAGASAVPTRGAAADSSGVPTGSPSPAVAIKKTRQRVSGSDGSSMRVQFTPDGLTEQGRQQIGMAITNTSPGPRRFFIQVEHVNRDDHPGGALNHYTDVVGAGKTSRLNLVADGALTMTSAAMCRSADRSLVTWAGWDRAWSEKNHTDEGLDTWSITGQRRSEAPMVIIEVTSRDKSGNLVDNWGWNSGVLPEIGVVWGPEVRPGSKVNLTSVATCSSWNTSNDD